MLHDGARCCYLDEAMKMRRLAREIHTPTIGASFALGLIGALAGALACSGGEIDGPLGPMTSQPGAAGSGALGPQQNGGAGNGSSTPPGSNPDGSGQQPNSVSELVLDDLTDGDGQFTASGIRGQWGTYSDGTSAITPPAMSAIVPTDGAIHVTGTGFNEWGAGLGLDLSSEGGGAFVDLARYASLKVRAKGAGTITVELATPVTTGSDEGGECAGDGCFGHYAATITLGAEYQDHVVTFAAMSQPSWGQEADLQLARVMGINFLSRAENGQSANIDLWVDRVALMPPAPAVVGGGGGGGTDTPVTGGGGGTVTLPLPVTDGSNPFSGKTLASEGGSLQQAFNSASGQDRDLLGKIVDKPAAYWMVNGDPSRAGDIAASAGANYPVIVAYHIPGRDCNNQSAGGAGDPNEYRSWVDAMASSLQGKQAAIILEPDALALGCVPNAVELVRYGVTSLRQNPGIAVYIDGGHSNWVPAGDMAGRLRDAGIEMATGFALNVSNFEPTQNLINFGKQVSSQVGNKPFVIDTSRNGRGPGAGNFCNPSGTGLGEPPTTNTGDPLVHAFLWVKRPGESDGACGECGNVPAGQFCTGYALELARNAIF
jgi:endoglucanase